MKNPRRLGMVMVFGALASGLPLAQANLVTNGNFASNAPNYLFVSGADWAVNPSPPPALPARNPNSPAGWVDPFYTSGNAGVNGLNTGSNVQGAFAPASWNGTPADFAWLGSSGGQLYQTLSTAAGAAYKVSFEYAAENGTPAQMSVYMVDASNFSASTSAPTSYVYGDTVSDTGLGNFTQASFQFTADSASTDILLFNNSEPFTFTNGFANFSDVSVTPVAPSPEPTAFGLIGCALSLLLLKRSRRA